MAFSTLAHTQIYVNQTAAGSLLLQLLLLLLHLSFCWSLCCFSSFSGSRKCQHPLETLNRYWHLSHAMTPLHGSLSLSLWVSGRSTVSGLSRQSTETAATVTTAVVAWLSGRFSELGRNEHFLLLSTEDCRLWLGLGLILLLLLLLFSCCWLCEPVDNSNVSPENSSLSPPYAPPLSLWHFCARAPKSIQMIVNTINII